MQIQETLQNQNLVEFTRLLQNGASHIVAPYNLNHWSMQAICSALTTPEFNVNRLSFNNYNFLDTTYIQSLAEALQSADCKITNLAFNRCILNQEHLNTLADGLNSQNNRVETLCLTISAIDDASAAIIVRILTSNHCKIKSLEINGHSLTAVGLKAILEASKNRNTLRSLFCDEPAQLNMTKDDVIDCFNCIAKDPYSKIDNLWLPIEQFSPAEQFAIRKHTIEQNKQPTKVAPGIVHIFDAMDNARNPLVFRQPAISRLPKEHKPMLAQLLMHTQPIRTALIERPVRHQLGI